jgi:hypothetical protein
MRTHKYLYNHDMIYIPKYCYIMTFTALLILLYFIKVEQNSFFPQYIYYICLLTMSTIKYSGMLTLFIDIEAL